ncbi:hypothetical protein BH24PSE2_BH24PSE2_17900 [soil metagenome]
MRFSPAWLLLGLVASAHAATDEDRRLATATTVLEQLADIPEQYMPASLLGSAHGVAVIPNVIKIGLGIGGRHGKGVLVVRDDRGGWSNPVFVSLTGGSFGWQIGAQSTDIILVFKTRRSIDGLTNGTLTLGADASVAAGPVGRHAEAATDIQLKSEVYSYSRTRGLFAGVALEGTAINIDESANAAFYDRSSITPDEIWSSQAPTAPAIAQVFVRTLDRATPALEGSAARSGSTMNDSVTRDAPADSMRGYPKERRYPAEAGRHAPADNRRPDSEESIRTYPVESTPPPEREPEEDG